MKKRSLYPGRTVRHWRFLNEIQPGPDGVVRWRIRCNRCRRVKKTRVSAVRTLERCRCFAEAARAERGSDTSPVTNIFEHIWKTKEDEGFVPLKPAEPTDLPPGTPEKIELLRARLEAGEDLFAKGERKRDTFEQT